MLAMPPGRWALFLILLLALAVRLLAAVWWEGRLRDDLQFAMPDSHSYWTLAKTIAAGETYQYGSADARVFRTPAYPLLLAPIIAMTGDTVTARWVARCMGALLGTACVALVSVWSQTLFQNRWAGVYAGVIAALYPGLIALSIIILSEALFVPLVAAQLVCWTRAEQSSGQRGLCWSAISGILAGIATLARPSWLLFVPFAAALGILFATRRAQRALQVAVMLSALALTMAPWWIRNYQVVGRFVPTTLQVGASLYDGLNPRATGASDMAFVDDYYRELNAARREGKLPATAPFEVVLDQRMKEDALRWARGHSWRVFELATVKFARMWNIWPNDEQFRGTAARMIIAASYLPVLLLAIVGACWFLRGGFQYALCVLPAMYLTALHMVFVSSLRYREPAMIGAIVLAAGVLCRIQTRLSDMNRAHALNATA